MVKSPKRKVRKPRSIDIDKDHVKIKANFLPVNEFKEVIQIEGWDGWFNLTRIEVDLLVEWLTRASAYLKSKEGKR